jgi:hypothetical protein
MKKITKKWFSKIVDKIFGYCDTCDTQGYHKCTECDDEITQKRCWKSDGLCSECDPALQFNFG